MLCEIKKISKKLSFLTFGLLISIIFYFITSVTYKSVLKFMYPLKHKDSVIRASQKYNVSKELIFAVIKCESGFDHKACSHANAKGLMQLTPETFNWLKSCYTHEENLQESDLENPDVNISYGTLFISILNKKYKSKSAVLSAYNAGMSIVSKWLSNKDYSSDGLNIDYIPYDETRNYVSRVKKAENIYKKLYFNEGEF